MNKVYEKVSKNIEDTRQIAILFVDKVIKRGSKKALIVGLSGDLGVGKTSFTQMVSKYLGIKKRVNSPTFVIMKKYPIKYMQYRFLFHLDAYRLKNEKELLHLGWKEILENKENLVLIEWPENTKKAMPKDSVLINIFHTEEGHRSFKIKKTKMV